MAKSKKAAKEAAPEVKEAAPEVKPAPPRIESLTEEQQARCPEFVERWTKIGLCTDRADRPRAEAGVRRAYVLAGLPEPERLVWCDSPLSMGLTQALTCNLVEPNSVLLDTFRGAAAQESAREAEVLACRAEYHEACHRVERGILRVLEAEAGAEVLWKFLVGSDVPMSFNDDFAAMVREIDNLSGRPEEAGPSVDNPSILPPPPTRLASVALSLWQSLDNPFNIPVAELESIPVPASKPHPLAGKPKALCEAIQRAAEFLVTCVVWGTPRSVGFPPVPPGTDMSPTRWAGLVSEKFGQASSLIKELEAGAESLRKCTREECRATMDNGFGPRILARVLRKVELPDSVLSAARESVWQSIYGPHDANWLAFYEYFKEVLGLVEETARLEGLWEVARSGGWWLPYDVICWISERPQALHRDDEGRMHNEAGPAMEYPDGWKLWYIGGVDVTGQIVMRPDTQTVEDILNESNEEVRRIRTERFGWLRFLQESGAVETDRRRNDRDSQEEILYRLSDGTQRFCCTDPSTGRKYSLGVPSEIQNCASAQMWMSHGLDGIATHRS